MPERISHSIGATAIAAVLLLASGAVGVPTKSVRADDCVTAPPSSAPEGSHWYYRTDRAKQRKCWHLSSPDQSVQQPAPPASLDAPSAAWRHRPIPVSDEEFKQAKANCTAKGNAGPVGAGSPEFKFYVVFLECMRAQGYEPAASSAQ